MREFDVLKNLANPSVSATSWREGPCNMTCFAETAFFLIPSEEPPELAQV